MEHTFDTLCDAITYAFRTEQTSLLSLDKICEVLGRPSLFLNSKSQGLTPCSTVTRRRVSSTLSSSDLFVRAGPPRTCLWAIRPNNPSFLSDGAIASSIEQMLIANGPLKTEDFVEKTDLTGAHLPLFERFLDEHATEFAQQSDGTWWFAGQPIPERHDFGNLTQAICSAFENIKEATVEEIHWRLCLSTVGEKSITRRSISRELSRRQDLFVHLSRAKYGLRAQAPRQFSPPVTFVQPKIIPSSVQRSSEPVTPRRPPIPMPIIMGYSSTNPPESMDAEEEANLIDFEVDEISPSPEDQFSPETFFSSDFNFQL